MTLYINGGLVQAFKSDGSFAASGTLEAYVAGTSTHQATYPTTADANAGTNANTWPVTLDSEGKAVCAINAATDIICKDSDGNILWSVPGINPTSTDLYDTNGKLILKFSSVSNSVNYWTISNASTAGTLNFYATGSDANITTSITSKGSGNLKLDAGATGTIILGSTSTGGVKLYNSVQFMTEGFPFKDTAGNNIALFSKNASAVNYLIFYNNATGQGPYIQCAGSDSNISLFLDPKGTGNISMQKNIRLNNVNPFIYDSNGNPHISFNSIANAVNYTNFTNNATGANPIISANGPDSNISLVLNSQGTKGVLIKGATDGTFSTTGYTGEQLTATASGVALLSAVSKTIVSLTLTAGNWILYGTFNGTNTGAVAITACEGSISPTNNTLDSPGSYFAGSGTSVVFAGATCMRFVSVNASTTYYLVGKVVFASSVTSFQGTLSAIRI